MAGKVALTGLPTTLKGRLIGPYATCMDRSRPEIELRLDFKFCRDSIESSSIKKYHAQLLFKPRPIIFYFKKAKSNTIRQLL